MGDITDKSISAIDAALASAQARKAARTGKPAASPKATKEPKASKPKLSDEEKAKLLADREAEREAKKAARAEERAKKAAERGATRSPAHMKKVAKAAEKLSPLGQAAQLLYNEATANFGAAELASLAAHIQHFNRVKATERALVQKVEGGQTVTIIGGEPRFIGKTGTVTKAQRIRCYVQIEGLSKPAYFYTSDVTVAEVAASAANG